MAVVVSACLLGERCKYNGGDNRNEAVIAFCRDREIIPVCPETAGGLPAPRPPSEIRDGQVWSKDGANVTEAFRAGALRCLESCAGRTVEYAILKARSPSCGSGEVYDGAFSGKTVAGDGVFAAMLKVRGIPVFTEDQLEEAAQCAG